MPAVAITKCSLRYCDGSLASLRPWNWAPGRRQMREARIVVGAFDDFARQKVVRFACPATRGLHVRLGLDSGPGYGQHATVDAGGIHGAQAHLTEIGQAFEKSFTALRRQVDDRRRPILLEPGSEEMLFDSDLLDHFWLVC